MSELNYEDQKRIVRDNLCAQCGGELTIHTDPNNGGALEIWCPHNPDHHGYIERQTYTQAYRQGDAVLSIIGDKIEKNKLLPGGYSVNAALAIIKTRFPRADMDEPSAALFLI